jgi:hypothetical protein
MENLDSQESQHISESPNMTKEIFTGYCNEAYTVLLEARQKKLNVSQFKDANLALRRMLGLFVDKEEYEKCSFIKKFLDENFKGNNDPIFDYRKL